MISVDTNVVVRLLTRDDEEQYQKSLNLFQDQEIFIADTVILETEWVLRFAYRYQPKEVCQGLRKLFGLPNVYVKDAGLIAKVIDSHEKGLDFADALHVALGQDYPPFYTFDAKLVKKSSYIDNSQVKLL